MKAVHFVVYEASVESASWWASVAAAAVLPGPAPKVLMLRQPPKPAQVSWSYLGLPGSFKEYLWGHRLVWLCH